MHNMEHILKNIKAFASDVDGVLTDGGILADLDGELFRTFDSKDGFAVRMATMAGYPVGIITGGRSESIRKRFLTCGVEAEDVYLGSRDKIEDFDDFCRRHGLKPEEVMYFGDDLPDAEMRLRGGSGRCRGRSPCGRRLHFPLRRRQTLRKGSHRESHEAPGKMAPGRGPVQGEILNKGAGRPG